MNYSSLISLILVSAALLFLPSAHSSSLVCSSCGPSLSPEQCNATQTGGAFCSQLGQGEREYCIAVTAEFTNGSKIGIRGCRAYSMAGCNSSIVCNSENETMPQGARFKRCIAECCGNYDYNCNQNLYPMLPTPEPEPSSSHTTVMTSSSMNSTFITTDKTPDPTSKSAALVRSYQWLFVLVVFALFLYIM